MINKNQRHKIKTNNGFIALMSAIIISVVLLLVVTSLGFNGFYNRSDILDSELKEKSSAFAEACVDTALLKLETTPSYGGSESVDVDKDGANDCTITSVSGSIIKVEGNYNNKYFTNLEVKFNPLNMSIVSWKETQN